MDLRVLVCTVAVLFSACSSTRPPTAPPPGTVAEEEAAPADSAVSMRPAAMLSAAARAAAVARHLRYESDDPAGLLVNEGYVVRYDRAQKAPAWTYHALSPDQVAPRTPGLDRRSRFLQDDRLPAAVQASHDDYSNSGFDRGHFTPAGDFTQRQALKDETFLVTNIAPMTPDLNQELWQELESRIRALVQDSAVTAYVITGALYASRRSRGMSPEKVGIPSHFYKLVYLEVADRPYLYAFLIPHRFAYDETNLACYQVTMDEVEAAAGEDFLDRLPEGEERLIEMTRMDAPWLGSDPCRR